MNKYTDVRIIIVFILVKADGMYHGTREITNLCYLIRYNSVFWWGGVEDE